LSDSARLKIDPFSILGIFISIMLFLFLSLSLSISFFLSLFLPPPPPPLFYVLALSDVGGVAAEVTFNLPPSIDSLRMCP